MRKKAKRRWDARTRWQGSPEKLACRMMISLKREGRCHLRLLGSNLSWNFVWGLSDNADAAGTTVGVDVIDGGSLSGWTGLGPCDLDALLLQVLHPSSTLFMAFVWALWAARSDVVCTRKGFSRRLPGSVINPSQIATRAPATRCSFYTWHIFETQSKAEGHKDSTARCTAGFWNPDIQHAQGNWEMVLGATGSVDCVLPKGAIIWRVDSCSGFQKKIPRKDGPTCAVHSWRIIPGPAAGCVTGAPMAPHPLNTTNPPPRGGTAGCLCRLPPPRRHCMTTTPRLKFDESPLHGLPHLPRSAHGNHIRRRRMEYNLEYYPR